MREDRYRHSAEELSKLTEGYLEPEPDPKPARPMSTNNGSADRDIDPYLQAALAGEVEAVTTAPEGQRNHNRADRRRHQAGRRRHQPRGH